MNNNTYCSPFESRYVGKVTSAIYSDNHRYMTWRWLWILLAEAERKCGIDISEEQIHEMWKNLPTIPYERVRRFEMDTHHDVVAHLKAFAEQCPKASPIIHLGATSCYVTDNTDVMLMVEAIDEICKDLATLVEYMASSAEFYRDTQTVGRTHFQPAQLVTVGKRYAMWSQDFKEDLQNLTYQRDRIRILGCRGATGTSDSFLQLFNGDTEKVKSMEEYISSAIGIPVFTVSGQTYTRKQDYYVLQVLSGIAQSASKFATDIRLLSGLGEVSESFGKDQVGSSAMPYKHNPITCENICGLSRYVIINAQNAAVTASSQWLERTLDDSSNRRLVIPEMFMATEVILDECKTIVKELQWNKGRIHRNVENHKDNAMLEGVLLAGVKHGGDRQLLHDKLVKYSTSDIPVAYAIARDPEFKLTHEEVESVRDKTSVGMTKQYVDKYVDETLS